MAHGIPPTQVLNQHLQYRFIDRDPEGPIECFHSETPSDKTRGFKGNPTPSAVGLFRFTGRQRGHKRKEPVSSQVNTSEEDEELINSSFYRLLHRYLSPFPLSLPPSGF